jgi:hypothetical protein
MRVLVLLFAVILENLGSGQSAEAQAPVLPQTHWEYSLGQGLRVGDSGVTVGGYGSLRYEDLHDRPRQFSASALSLFVSWDSGSRVRFFSEWELEDFAVVREGKAFGSRSNPFEIERFYADVYISDALNLRFGKFLTPIGRWNLIHADPLVWTTSRPLVTFRSFSQNITGGMLYGTVPLQERELDYSVYLEVTDELDPDQREEPVSEAAGLHVLYHLANAMELGLSYSSFERQEGDGKRENLFGADLFWTQQRFEVTSEFAYRFGEEKNNSDEWGIFLQGTAPLFAHLFAIGRYEFFSSREPIPGVHLWTAGLAFRPISPLVFKAEYSVGHRNVANVPEGFSTSVSLLF